MNHLSQTFKILRESALTQYFLASEHCSCLLSGITIFFPCIMCILVVNITEFINIDFTAFFNHRGTKIFLLHIIKKFFLSSQEQPPLPKGRVPPTTISEPVLPAEREGLNSQN